VKTLILLAISMCILTAGAAQGHQDSVTENPGIAEKTGQYAPLDLIFLNENGKPVKLSSIVTKPTILVLAYFTCDSICPQILGGLATAIGNIKLTPGKDYKLLTISFDEDDTPLIAKDQQFNYLKATGMLFPPDAWHFLTGDKENIKRLTEAVGFRFKKEVITGTVGFSTRQESRGFIHPSVLIFLAPDGKITRYLYVEQSHYGTLAPIAFSTVDITTSLQAAAQGKTWTSTINPLLLCFPGLSANEARFYTVLASIGTMTLICIFAFYIYLRRTSKKESPDNRDATEQ
jgi:protein SCO1/2